MTATMERLKHVVTGNSYGEKVYATIVGGGGFEEGFAAGHSSVDPSETSHELRLQQL